MKRLLLLVATLFFSGMALAAVNINTATKEELEALPEIGPVKAQAIIDYRKENGPFKSIDQIKDVKGIGPATFDKIKGDISLTGPTTRSRQGGEERAREGGGAGAGQDGEPRRRRQRPSRRLRSPRARQGRADEARTGRGPAPAATPAKTDAMKDAKATGKDAAKSTTRKRQPRRRPPRKRRRRRRRRTRKRRRRRRRRTRKPRTPRRKRTRKRRTPSPRSRRTRTTRRPRPRPTRKRRRRRTRKRRTPRPPRRRPTRKRRPRPTRKRRMRRPRRRPTRTRRPRKTRPPSNRRAFPQPRNPARVAGFSLEARTPGHRECARSARIQSAFRLSRVARLAGSPMYPTLESTVGNTPLVRLQRMPGATSNVDPRQARGKQPCGLGQGPAGAVDAGRGREARGHQARRHARRGDLRQHGHRLGDGRGDEGLPDDPGDAGQPVAGAAPVDARIRRRAGADAQGRRHGACARRLAARSRRCERLHPRPVRQSGQSARPLSRHRPRDLARHAGRDHAFRFRNGHDRHDHGRVAFPQGAESGGRHHRRAARGGLADSGHPQVARSVPAEDLRPPPGRPGRKRLASRSRDDDAAARERRGHLRRHFRGRRVRGGAARRARGRRTRRSCSSSAIAATAICRPACSPRDTRRGSRHRGHRP